MSNQNCSTSSCTPCAPATVTQESVASQLQNLAESLFGPFTKTIENGRAVWSAQCDADGESALCLTRGEDEGFICFLLRVINDFGLIFGGTWSSSSTYCKNTYVSYGGGAYVSLQNVPANQQPDISPAYWQLAISGIVGPAGPAGPAGSSANPTYAVAIKTGNYTTTDTDAVIICQPAGVMQITLPLGSSLTAGKYYFIQTNGAATVTVASTGPNTINGGASETLTVAGESIEIVFDNVSNWTLL